MFDELSLGFFGRKLREAENRPQHFAHISRREGWQRIEVKLLSQFKVTLAVFDPIELGSGDGPLGASGQSSIMFPGKVLLGVDCWR